MYTQLLDQIRNDETLFNVGKLHDQWEQDFTFSCTSAEQIKLLDPYVSFLNDPRYRVSGYQSLQSLARIVWRNIEHPLEERVAVCITIIKQIPKVMKRMSYFNNYVFEKSLAGFLKTAPDNKQDRFDKFKQIHMYYEMLEGLKLMYCALNRVGELVLRDRIISVLPDEYRFIAYAQFPDSEETNHQLDMIDINALDNEVILFIATCICRVSQKTSELLAQCGGDKDDKCD